MNSSPPRPSAASPYPSLYAGTDGGVFKSTDSGGTWAAMNSGLGAIVVNALALDPTGGTTLYAGSSGVWQLQWPLSGPSDCYTVTPCRVLDTRDALLGGPIALAAGSTTTVPVAGHCGVPPTATATAINLTMTAASGSGYLTLFLDGTSRPLVSAMNYAVNQTRANSVVAPLAPSGGLKVFVGQGVGRVHVIIDVSGYFR